MRSPFGIADRRISAPTLLSEGLLDDISELTYEQYMKFFDAFAERSGLSIDSLPNGLHLYSGGVGDLNVFLVSGQHGDERAGPVALLEMVRDGELGISCAIRICPITNPVGWDEHVRRANGVDINRVWDPRKSPPEIAALMISVVADPPNIFLDLHESNKVRPKSGKMYDLRHVGTSWGHEMLRALGPSVAGVKLHTHIPGSAEKFAHDRGVPGTAAVETNTHLTLSERVEFHKRVIRLAISTGMGQ